MKRDLIILYNYFTRRIYKDLSYEFFSINLSEANKRASIDFLAALCIEVGMNRVDIDYLYEYCTFQFEYIRSKTPLYMSQRIPLRQVFNKKALKRWVDKNPNYMFYARKSMSEKGLDIRHLTEQEAPLKGCLEIIESEEREKARFFNKENGFSHCFLCTSLFNHQSKICALCIHTDKCKPVLKEKYLALYVDRGYEL